MKSKILKVGTLFSGIGAFEHALQQLKIPHKVQFACDCGERELPLTYANLYQLTKGLNNTELAIYCENYINKIGVKKEYRAVETKLLYEIALQRMANNDAPIVLKFHKEGRKSMVSHKLIITQEQIISLTPNMTSSEREQYVNELYAKMGEHNYGQENEMYK